jgi:hypothetical protein
MPGQYIARDRSKGKAAKSAPFLLTDKRIPAPDIVRNSSKGKAAKNEDLFDR